MNNNSGFVTFLAETSQVHLPALRFALRSVVATDSFSEHINSDADNLLRLVAPALIWQVPTRSALSARYAKIVSHHPVDSNDALSLCKLFASNESVLWPAFENEVLSTWQREPEVVKQAFTDTLAALDADEVHEKGQHENLGHVASLYGLNPVETQILQYAVAAKQWPRFRDFLKHMPFPSMQAAWSTLPAMIGCTMAELGKAMEPDQALRSCSLVKLDRAPDHMGEFVNVGPVAFRLFLMHADSRDSLQAKVLTAVAPPLLTIADFPHFSEEFGWMVNCLKAAAKSGEKGVNILLQGPAGSGKTEFARLMVQAAELSGFDVKAEVDCTSPMTDTADRLDRFEWSQHILRTHGGAVLVFDGVGDAAQNCAMQLKELLDNGSVPTVWIGDDSDQMSDSILRRFAFHLKLRQPPSSARRHLVSKVVAEFDIDAGMIDAIAAEPNLSPAQLVMAARFARLGAKDKSASQTKALLCALDASQRVAGRVPTGLLQATCGSTWDLDSLNLETSAPLTRILDGLRRTGCASLAFHGIPGTGKSSLAAYIANVLDRPLLTKRVSDLSSKWIGDTEKSIASMFHQAAADNAVLLLDEADSFLRDRSRARSTWEITQVNELLQQIESFKGVFICATNLVKDLDAAALRRFTFKIKFLPLDDLHRRRMLALFALSSADATLPPAINDRLADLSQLAPGDFATVRRQELLVDERFSLESWITELEREHAIRMPATKARAAFV